MRKRIDQDFNFEEIKEQVTEWIPTPNGRIGVIIPENEPTEEQLNEMYDALADAAIEVILREKEEIKRLNTQNPSHKPHNCPCRAST